MRKTMSLAAVLACTAIMGVVASPANAQQGTNVAVIDVSEIFKNHTRFEQAQKQMKLEVEAFEGEVRQTQTKLQTMQNQLKQTAAGTPQYKTTEEEMAQIASDMQVRTQLKRKEFLEKEAKLYSNTYNEMVGSVASFCQKNNIGIVFRFNGEQIDATNPQSVMQGVNRSIVYQQKLNITQFILADLNRVPPQSPATATRPSVPGRSFQ